MLAFGGELPGDRLAAFGNDDPMPTLGRQVVEVQGKCPFKWPAEMSLGYAAIGLDEDVVGPAQGRRVGGPSASRYFLTVALWIPNSRSIARSDIPLRLAF